MENTNYLDLIGKYLSGAISPEEEARLMQWAEEEANRKFLDEMIQLWSISNQYEEDPLPVNTTAAWKLLERKIDRKESRTVTNSTIHPAEGGKVIGLRPWLNLMRYAAALLLVAALAYWMYDGGTTGSERPQLVELASGPGEELEVQLPDGSQVLLNEKTRLSYKADFEERRVELSGEAFFEVAKKDGKSFTIVAAGSSTTVLGTSFNVRAYPDEPQVEVSVRTGTVVLRSSEDADQSVTLEKGKAGIYDKSRQQVEEVAITNADAWRTNKLNFDNQRMELVIPTLERYFDIQVEVSDPKLLKCYFLGEFDEPKLEDILNTLSFTMGLTVTKENGNYVLKGDASRCN